MANKDTKTHRPAAEAGMTAPGVGLATRPAGAFLFVGSRRDAGEEVDMLVVTLDRNRLGYEVARAVRRSCRQCGERWWRVYALPGGYPRDYELPAEWAGGLFVREWESRSLAHFVHCSGSAWEPASLVDDDTGSLLARGIFAVGLFHEGPLAGHRKVGEPVVEPEIPGWEIIARYCLPRPGHHVRGMWRCWWSRENEEARGEYALDVEEETTICRRCAEQQQAAEQSEEGEAAG